MNKPDYILIAAVDINELVVRMVESLREESRPPGFSADEVVASFDDQMREILLRQARVAADYVVACCLGTDVHRVQRRRKA